MTCWERDRDTGEGKRESEREQGRGVAEREGGGEMKGREEERRDER